MASRVKISGQLPDPDSVLGALDAGARDAINSVAQMALPIISSHTPRRSGKLARAWSKQVKKTATGQQLRLGPDLKRGSRRTGAYYGGMVENGTGIYGPKGAPIQRRQKDAFGRPRPFVLQLPGGREIRTRTIDGQRPQRFIARIRFLVDGRAEQLMQTKADEIARRLERDI